jgi:cytochrome c553
MHPSKFLIAVLWSLLVAAGEAAEPTSVALPDTMQQRLLACTGCHGKDGRSTTEGYFPRIAGKPAGYLYNQLLNFRDGRRNNTTMAYLVEFMTDSYLKQIAEHFASLELPYAAPQPVVATSAELLRGEQLVRFGDDAKNLPACSRCHGEAMMGVAPAVPGLLGLPRDYLIGQLGAWRTGHRNSAPPDCMHDIAQRLAPEDVVAVASWLSSRNVPVQARPQQEASQAMPLKCGSAMK